MTAVLCDMDGVIVSSEAHWKRHESEDIYPATVPDQEVPPEETTGMYYREIYDYLDDNYGAAISREEFLELFEEAGRQIYGEEAEIVAGVPELLRDVRADGHGVSLVTSSPHHWIDVVLDRFDLEDDFDAIVSAADVEAGKPAPDVYERAAELAGEDPTDCIAIEDSTNGASAAKAAGAFTIGFTGVHNDIDRSIPDVVAEDVAELRERLLERL
ncbi:MULTISPECIES: HAD family phosphatase [unclassified Halorhabdus]|uniref:HAD family hydrolase n=1 Tax=unclassified Halorhabdus TaxID=2621901 RepID=UPI0023DCB947|nr:MULTISPECIES: HAD family phosphatase [unclassified Halorhabdus]WEL18986.1 HAD superfamily hydrolase [Halorhabdus sp. SVX81]WEL22814.1 HAD superfamily hydrolase [Halorhabdus sp. BNX81]